MYHLLIRLKSIYNTFQQKSFRVSIFSLILARTPCRYGAPVPAESVRCFRHTLSETHRHSAVSKRKNERKVPDRLGFGTRHLPRAGGFQRGGAAKKKRRDRRGVPGSFSLCYSTHAARTVESKSSPRPRIDCSIWRAARKLRAARNPRTPRAERGTTEERRSARLNKKASRRAFG